MGIEVGRALEASVALAEVLVGAAEPASIVVNGSGLFLCGRNCFAFARKRLVLVGFTEGELLGLGPVLGIADGRRDGTEDGAIEGIWDGSMEGS